MKRHVTELIKVLDKNKTNNILILGADNNIFDSAIIIPSKIPSECLGISIDDHGELIYPQWLQEIIANNKKESILLVISNIDDINIEDQNKFYGILKYRGVNGYSFPQQTQIVVTSKNLTSDKISPKLLSLMITYKHNI